MNNSFKRIAICISIAFSVLLPVTTKTEIDPRVAGLVVVGGGVSLAGCGILYSLLKKHNKKVENQEKKQQHLAIKVAKKFGSTTLDIVKGITGITFTVGGVAIILGSKYLIDFLDNESRPARAKHAQISLIETGRALLR